MSDIVPPQIVSPTSAAWWQRKLQPEQRQKILKDLAIQKPDKWELRFGLMLALSVVVAVMGLQLDSAAIVIGAMLLAPLMQPVLACAACMAMGLFSKAGVMAIRLLVASVGSVVIAVILAALLPEQLGFTEEVLSRTRPDGRDLIVALAAGAAGAYATVREDVSSSLPGVAVAVALVPPLGTLGIALQARDIDKAEGAFLLYSTNLVAIVLVGVFVFVVTGFVAPRRLETNYVKVAIAVLGMTVLVSLVGWPLIQTSRSSAQDARDDALALTIVEQWKAATDSVEEVDVRDEQIVVSLTGRGQPPNDEDLRANLLANFGEKEVLFSWIQVGVPAVTTTTASADAMLAREVEAFVQQWIDGLDNARLNNFELNGTSVRVDASGSGEPPSVNELSELLDAEFQTAFEVRINWGESIAITNQPVEDPLAEERELVSEILDEWAAEEEVLVDKSDFNGSKLDVVVRGEQQPNISDLQQALNEALTEQPEDPATEVEDFPLSVLYSQQIELAG